MISYEWFIFWLCIAVFVGVMVGSRMLKPHKVKHIDGYLNVDKEDRRLIYQLEPTTPPELLQDQKNVVFEVRLVSPKDS